ncbi:MAG TPA: isoprenylcysteine carboxylmethyltransferase family protein [Candidatus Binataceae bacterium]|nr:isoprenylcysteine carboxylmethyltransferase family protein [Candidatus Binataceae bacterium]
MEATAPRVSTEIRIKPPAVSAAGLKHALSNLALAACFFLVALPSAQRYQTGIANMVWVVGAMIMGVLSLVRVPPRDSMVNIRAFGAIGGMLIFPSFMRPDAPATGILSSAGLVLEVSGVVLSQVARLWMGRSFGFLPANRGIVSRGPFSIVRHPIYLGWLILMIGYACSYPTIRNWFFVVVSWPFLAWRISLEEEVLNADPEYRAYESRVHFKLVPHVY